MDELELIIDLHRNSVRQGPGGAAETQQALNFMLLPKGRRLRVADIGCGSGGPTLTLAEHLNTQITAVDLFPAFLEELNKKAQKLGYADKISTLEASMDELPFRHASLDIIWSEGAIYNVGFERGVKLWKDYLKAEGYLAVSEITWTTNDRPPEVADFWQREYPEVDTAANKISLLEKNGFTLVGYFLLPESSWVDNYYRPLAARFEAFLARHNHSNLAQKVVDDSVAEMTLYRQFKDYYNYGFYVARKR